MFSGIGGFALAAKLAGFRTVAFCEKEEYWQRWLPRCWPGVPIEPDIFGVNGAGYRGVDLLTGGFPCQPFSQAGQRRGAKDDRHLWPEMLRVIKEARPTWVIGENVIGFVGMGLDALLSDLEGEGYSCRPFIIPAVGVGAQQYRYRVWIVAHRDGKRKLQSKGVQQNQRGRIGNQDFNVSNPNGERWNASAVFGGKFAESGCEKSEEWNRERAKLIKPFPPAGEPLEALLTPETCGAPYGLPDGMDRIKGLGNAIVPQVAYQILKPIYDLITK